MEERRLPATTPTPTTTSAVVPPAVGAGLQYEKKRWVSVVFSLDDGASTSMTTTTASPATTITPTTLPRIIDPDPSIQTKATQPPTKIARKKKPNAQDTKDSEPAKRKGKRKADGLLKIESKGETNEGIKRPTALGKRKTVSALVILQHGEKQRRCEKDTEESANRHDYKALQFWTVDSHLQTYARARKCVQLFDQTSLTLVHPAVVADSSLQWYFFESDSSKDACVSDISPLAFNITLAICLGAWAAGDRQLEEEFWTRARHQAGAIFDVCEYHVADGLMRMFGYLGLKGQIEQAGYYAAPALVTLEKLNCSNSTIYSWLIIFRYMDNQEMNTFQQKASHALTMPDLTKTRASTKLLCHTREGDEAKWGQYSVDLSLEAVFSDLILNIGILCSQATTNPDNRPLLQQLEQRLSHYKKRWLPLRQGFRHPHRVKMDAVFAVNSTITFRSLGKMDLAVRSSLDFLALAEDPVFRFQPLLQPTVYYPLQVLLETGNIVALRRLVAFLAPGRGGHFLDIPSLEPFKAFHRPVNRITESNE